MFKFYLNKIYEYLKRQLSEPEIETARKFFSEGKNWHYTAEYLGR